jgi:hypothetical protein
MIAGLIGTVYGGGFTLLYSGSTGELAFNGVYGTVRIRGAVSTNTDYLIKVSWDGTDYKMFVSTDNGATYTQIGSTVSNTGNCGYGDFGFGKDAGTQYYESFLGTIDLAKAYLKTGENIVWSGMDAPGLHQRVAKGHEVIAFQAPTAQNNYTWYRKYADGWVEQGGYATTSGDTGAQITLPVTMSDAHYLINGTCNNDTTGGVFHFMIYENQTTTGFTASPAYAGEWRTGAFYWEVRGMAAN